jgi:hypothetical protein
MFSVAGEGLCVGPDSGEPVTGDYLGDHPHIDIITVNGLFADNAIRSWVARRAGACC